MHKIKEQVGQVVAADTQASAAALDMAILMHSRLCASSVEAASASQLPIATTQGLLESLSAGIGGLVESRSKLAAAVRHLNVIQGRSNLRETNFGCPGGVYPIKGTLHEVEELASADN